MRVRTQMKSTLLLVVAITGLTVVGTAAGVTVSPVADDGFRADGGGPADVARATTSDGTESGDTAFQRGTPTCKGAGEPISVAVAGWSTDGQRGGSDDNVIDVNVVSKESRASDCDTLDVTLGSQETGGADDDSVDAALFGRSHHGGDRDDVDVDLLSERTTAGHDADSIDADVGSSARAGNDDDSVEIDLASDQKAGSDEDNTSVNR